MQIQKMLLGSCLLLFCFFAACTKKEAIYKVSDIEGDWLRLESSKPKYDSMVVHLVDSSESGIITHTNPSGSFTTGSIKWRNIVPSSGINFSYEDLGSDGKYYKGTMTLTLDNASGKKRLHLVIDETGNLNGNDQVWEEH